MWFLCSRWKQQEGEKHISMNEIIIPWICDGLAPLLANCLPLIQEFMSNEARDEIPCEFRLGISRPFAKTRWEVAGLDQDLGVFGVVMVIVPCFCLEKCFSPEFFLPKKRWKSCLDYFCSKICQKTTKISRCGIEISICLLTITVSINSNSFESLNSIPISNLTILSHTTRNWQCHVATTIHFVRLAGRMDRSDSSEQATPKDVSNSHFSRLQRPF